MLIEVKAVFAMSLEKIQTAKDTAQQHLPINKLPELREAIEAINAGSQAKIQTNQDIVQEHLLVNKQTMQEAIVDESLAKKALSKLQKLKEHQEARAIAAMKAE